MTNPSLKVMFYTVKVWLTAVFVTPAIFVLPVNFNRLQSSFTQEWFQVMIEAYKFGVVAELLFSTLTWLLFSLVVGFMVQHITDPVRRRGLITIAGLLLTMLTFIIASLFVFRFSEAILVFGTANCICIPVGCWFYNLNIQYGD